MITLLCHAIHAIRLETADKYCTIFRTPTSKLSSAPYSFICGSGGTISHMSPPYTWCCMDIEVVNCLGKSNKALRRMPPRHNFIPMTITTKILQSRMMSHFSLWWRLGLVPDSSAIRQSSFLPTARDTARYVCLQAFKTRQVGRLVFCRGVQAPKILHGTNSKL